MDPDAQLLASLRCVEWARSEGLLMDSLEPARFGDAGLGMRATADLAAGAVLVAVPQHLLMSTASARRPKLARPQPQQPQAVVEVASLLDALPAEVALPMHLLHELARDERVKPSAWAPYLPTLPASYDTTLFWTAAELAELQSPSLCGTGGSYLLGYGFVVRGFCCLFLKTVLMN